MVTITVAAVINSIWWSIAANSSVSVLLPRPGGHLPGADHLSPCGERPAIRHRGRSDARERDVLRLIGQGHSNAEIAEELCISELTVKSHIGRIFVKLDLRDRAAAIVYAYDHVLVTPRYST
jgi:DNA-binding NarL/FixJ family response regulator